MYSFYFVCQFPRHRSRSPAPPRLFRFAQHASGFQVLTQAKQFACFPGTARLAHLCWDFNLCSNLFWKAIAERLKVNLTLYFFLNSKFCLTLFVNLYLISTNRKNLGGFAPAGANPPTKTKKFLCDFFLFFSPPKFWKNGKGNFCFGFGS